MGGLDLPAGGLILTAQAQQQGPFVAGGGILGKAGHHLVAAGQGLRELLQVQIPQAVIGLQAALGQVSLAAGLQHQGAGDDRQQGNGGTGHGGRGHEWII